ncbi:MAG: type 1 family protein [Schlesneria sp.]|nr:type 1 family protein [Schlesneria sp.]
MIDVASLSQIEQLGQQHVLRYWSELSETQKARLNEQLTHVDWEMIRYYLSDLKSSERDVRSGRGTIAPPAHIVRCPRTDAELDSWDEARRKGEQILREGKAGVILLAGGQGTRLGFPHPKGMYPIGPVSGKSLFEMFADQVVTLVARFGHSIPYLIMTSDGTHEETVAFFEQRDYFGLGHANVFFFRQGYAPCVDSETGKLLCVDKGVLGMSPDGHGGLLAALLKAGLFSEMKNRGVEFLFLHQVDNPLVKICDPAFLGLHVRHGSEVSTKVVSKTSPDEKVGLAVDLNGRTAIIEYSDLPSELANEREADGGLRFWAGNAAIHIFNRSFMETVATSAANLPWHRAHKRIPHIDDEGHLIQSEVENGIKFERFLFDTLPLAKTALIVESSRNEEFAPLKNSSGEFSAEYVRTHIVQVALNWLKAAAVTVPEAATVEISFRFASSAEDLALRVKEVEDLTFDRPVYIGP